MIGTWGADQSSRLISARLVLHRARHRRAFRLLLLFSKAPCTQSSTDHLPRQSSAHAQRRSRDTQRVRTRRQEGGYLRTPPKRFSSRGSGSYVPKHPLLFALMPTCILAFRQYSGHRTRVAFYADWQPKQPTARKTRKHSPHFLLLSFAVALETDRQTFF